MKTFAEFWPFYLGEHSNRTNRILHVVGVGLALVALVLIVVRAEWTWLWLPFIIAYGFAWTGHFIFEKNVPATFKYPLWSLRADVKMFFAFIFRRI